MVEKIQGTVKLKRLPEFVKQSQGVLNRWATSAKCNPEDLTITVTIEKPFRPRTTGYKSQNHCLNGYIQQICMETGQDFASTKTYIKQRAIDMGYPILKRKVAGGVVDVVDWWGNPVGISEADASISDCSLLIETAVLVASELGIILRISDD